MPEVPNAYRCDYCHVLMEPIERNDGQWHTKWCSACGEKLYDVYLGNVSVPVRRDRSWLQDPDDNSYGTDAD
jgi:hypothetical protein